jgi:hypothetical protein
VLIILVAFEWHDTSKSYQCCKIGDKQLIHVKCIHELCSLIRHIALYLIVSGSHGQVFH